METLTYFFFSTRHLTFAESFADRKQNLCGKGLEFIRAKVAPLAVDNGINFNASHRNFRWDGKLSVVLNFSRNFSFALLYITCHCSRHFSTVEVRHIFPQEISLHILNQTTALNIQFNMYYLNRSKFN